MIHKLKIERGYLDDLLREKKKAEARLNNRDYQVGDILEFNLVNPMRDPDIKDGPVATFRVTHIHKGLGLARGYVMLSVERVFL